MSKSMNSENSMEFADSRNFMDSLWWSNNIETSDKLSETDYELCGNDKTEYSDFLNDYDHNPSLVLYGDDPFNPYSEGGTLSDPILFHKKTEVTLAQLNCGTFDDADLELRVEYIDSSSNMEEMISFEFVKNFNDFVKKPSHDDTFEAVKKRKTEFAPCTNKIKSEIVSDSEECSKTLHLEQSGPQSELLVKLSPVWKSTKRKIQIDSDNRSLVQKWYSDGTVLNSSRPALQNLVVVSTNKKQKVEFEKRIKLEFPGDSDTVVQNQETSSNSVNNTNTSVLFKEDIKYESDQQKCSNSSKKSTNCPYNDTKYFWQYNLQSKGPKERRGPSNFSQSDPYKREDFEDPVFDSSQQGTSFVHNGKARKGEGTDVTPNPRKLSQIGNELNAVNQEIEGTTLSAETKTNVLRNKNKLASRACRLKKKAQHEANKIKLDGLNREHSQLMSILCSAKAKLRKILKSANSQRTEKFSTYLENLVKDQLKDSVAGNTDLYVNSVLDTLSSNKG